MKHFLIYAWELVSGKYSNAPNIEAHKINILFSSQWEFSHPALLSTLLLILIRMEIYFKMIETLANLTNPSYANYK
jgi:hypothetical protein